MHIKAFLSENVYFGSCNKHALVTMCLNNTGNLFLSPIRHLLQGRTATCVVMPSDRRYKQVLFGDVNDKHPHGIERFLKTTISIVLFIPCTILGAVKYFYEAKEPDNINGNLAFLDTYPNLYLSTEEERIRNPSLECVIGCLLKLFADNKIPISEFFSKMDLIDKFANENPVDQNTLGVSMKFVPIQNVIKLGDKLETMVIAVEKYLIDKGVIGTS